MRLPNPISFLTNPWTPPSQQWDKHEIRITRDASGWYVVQATWPGFGGRVVTKDWRADAYGKVIGSQAEAKRLAVELAIGLSGVEPRNPNVIRVLDLGGRCVTATLAGWEISCDPSIYDRDDATHHFMVGQNADTHQWYVGHLIYSPQHYLEKRAYMPFDGAGNTMLGPKAAYAEAHRLAQELSQQRPSLKVEVHHPSQRPVAYRAGKRVP